MNIRKIAVGTLIGLAVIAGSSDAAWARQGRGADDGANHL